MRRFRPAAIDAADQPGFTGQRRFPGTNHVRAEIGIRAAGLQRQRLGGIIFGIDRGKRLQPFRLVLFIPCQQDRFLVGAGTDDDAQAGDVFRFAQRFNRAAGFDVEAQRVFTVGGEIKLLFTLFGDGNIGDRRIIFTGGHAQRPVFP